MLTCRSSTVMTYRYMRSPCIFRLPGGGFQPLIVNTFRHCRGYSRTQHKQLLSVGIHFLELESLSVHARFLLPAAPAQFQKQSLQTHLLSRAQFLSPLQSTSLPFTPRDMGESRHSGPLGCTGYGFLAVLVFKWQLLNQNLSGRAWES